MDRIDRLLDAIISIFEIANNMGTDALKESYVRASIKAEIIEALKVGPSGSVKSYVFGTARGVSWSVGELFISKYPIDGFVVSGSLTSGELMISKHPLEGSATNNSLVAGELT